MATDIYELSLKLQDGEDHYKQTINLPVKEALLEYVKEHFDRSYSEDKYLKRHFVQGMKNDWYFYYDDPYDHKVITAVGK